MCVIQSFRQRQYVHYESQVARKASLGTLMELVSEWWDSLSPLEKRAVAESVLGRSEGVGVNAADWTAAWDKLRNTQQAIIRNYYDNSISSRPANGNP